MLKKFSVTNYKNFKQTITFDFSKVSDYQFGTCCIRDNLINKAIIFGANGSGKSNLGLAIFDVVQVLTDRTLQPLMLDSISFLNINNASSIAKFEYEFLLDGKTLTYKYSKSNPTTLVRETLEVGGETVFDCDFTSRAVEKQNMKLIGASSIKIDQYHWDLSFARYIATNASLSEHSAIKTLMEFVNGMLWFRCLQENGYIGILRDKEILSNWIIENQCLDDFKTFLKDVAGLDYDLRAIEQSVPVPIKTIVAKGKNRVIYFDPTASTGTHALMLLYYWIKHFNKVKFVFMDEFDAFYHFSLAKEVLEKIIKDYPEIQVVFTSHNTILANNPHLRPDCCFTLVNGGLKSFKDRTTRELRESLNFEKLLRSGEFDEE